ncbi:MAG: DUF2207 domain-containing protein [Parcubacteria group bacterium]
MKKNILIFSLLILLTTPFSSSARENVNYWYIKDYQVEIDIKKDDSAIITENIFADCGSCRNKHGIFRIISETINTPEGSYYTPIELISITDFEGNSYKYQTSKQGSAITWKIGDPNITVQGENDYRIIYRVDNIIREQTDFDELYWNILGTFWDLEIDNFTAQIKFPEPLTKNDIETYYYSGKQESKDNKLASARWLDENTLEISSTETINKNEGITVSASFDKGYINHQEISKPQDNSKGFISEHILNNDKTNNNTSLFSLLAPFYLFIIPIIVLIISFIFYKKHKKKNPYYKKPTVTHFTPPSNISPILMGLMISKLTLKPKYITATIVKLATLKLLKIEETETKILFFKQNKLNFLKLRDIKDIDKLDNTEKYIFNTMFSSSDNVSSTKLQTIFRSRLSKIKKEGVNELKDKGYILEKSPKIKIIFLILFILSIFTFNVISAIIFFVFYSTISNKTESGQELMWKLKGFETYMTVAETDRHKFYEQENIFTKLLPYSIIFGSIKLWVNKMKDIYGEEYIKNSLYWYSGASVLSLNSNIEQISSSIDKISSNINKSTGSSSGAGGGGFSGGGSGGGGGGGW